MNLTRDKILIVGGYGTVGAVLSKLLCKQLPGKVIVAGRDCEKGRSFIAENDLDAQAMKVDLESETFDDIIAGEINTAICCIEYLQADHFLLFCIDHQINYTELATSFEAFQRFKKYAGKIEESGVCLIPGVGLMPGLSGVFVQDSISKLGDIDCVQSFVLLGPGENHGLDAIRWMMENTDKEYLVKTNTGEKNVHSFTDPLSELLLTEDNPRNFYRFNFGDQQIIVNTGMADEAHTRLAFDSRFVTRIIAVFKKLGLLNRLSKVKPQTIKKWLSRLKLGSEKYAIQCHCYGKDKGEITYLAEGESEAHGTAVVAAYAGLLLYAAENSFGVKRFEEILIFSDFIEYLRAWNINIRINIQ